MPKLNIYIVEDEPLIARILAQTVNSTGHFVCGMAASFDKAVDDLHRLDPDIIITDIMLNGNKTGIDLAHYINNQLHIPFIFQSSITDQQLIDEAMKTAPVLFIAKPLKRQQLVNALSAIVNNIALI